MGSVELIVAQTLVSLLKSNISVPNSDIPVQSNAIGPRWRMSTVQQSTLRAWFQSHKKFPYPSVNEKEILSQQTKLSIKQISTWFVNRRRRADAHRKHKRGQK